MVIQRLPYRFFLLTIFGLVIYLPLHGQKDIQLEQLRLLDVLPSAYAYDESSTLYTLSSVQSTTLSDGNVVGDKGGKDILLSSWHDDLSIDNYISIGSAFDDVANHLSFHNGKLYAGGGFWDELIIDDVGLSVEAGNRGAFLLQFSETFTAIRGLSLSSSTRVRLGDVIIQPDETLLVIGYYENDLFFNENRLFNKGRGIFIVQINDQFDVLAQSSIASTGLVHDIEAFRKQNESLIGVTFQDTLIFADTFYRTRNDDVQNSALITLNEKGDILNHQFIKTSFDHTLLLDETAEDILVHINYGGNLVVGEFSVPGRPSNAQTASIYFDDNLRAKEVLNWTSETHVQLIATRFGEQLSLGLGQYDHWISAQENFPWVCNRFESRLPQQLYFQGEDVLLSELIPLQNDILVTGVFTGSVRVADLALTSTETQYVPFFARLAFRDPEQELPFFIYDSNTQSLEFIQTNVDSDIVIYDIMGRIRYQGKQAPSLSIDQFTSGLYIIVMKAGESSRTAPFIKL